MIKNIKKSKTYMGKAIILPALFSIFILLSGCIGGQGKEVSTQFYTFEYEPREFSDKAALPCAIKIERFRSASYYETNRIVYKENPSSIDSYYYHRWWSPPAELITYFLLRDMRESGLFKAVLPFDTQTPYTHVIEGYLEEIYEKDNPEGWVAVLSVNITLLSAEEPDPAEKVLLQKEYRQTEPADSKTPLALANAMSKAMSRVSESIIIDVYDLLSR